MSQIKPDQHQQYMQTASELLNAMANATRLVILSILSENELSVGALCDQIGISQSALSQHLTKLRMAGLVSTRRKSQMVYYRCDTLSVKRVLALLSEIFTPERAPVTNAA
jgi:DNA-binding transcriptional ArsR family regulator